ncbi:MAG: ABC transporter ATP-binding protein [Acidobacteria bacterium]|nr:ABC transporter ATP-binding protein [Acidobacteriota bacterium]
MTSFHEEEILGKAYDKRLARRLLGYLYPYRRVVLLSVFFLLVVSALQLAGPYLTKVAIDRYIRTGNIQGLNGIALLFLGVLLAQFCFAFAQTYLMNWTGQKIMYDLRVQIFTHIQKLHVGYFDRNPVGRIITRVTTDVDVLNELFTSGVISIFGDIFTLAGIVLIMLWLNWKLALVSFSVIPVLFVASIIFKVKVRDSYRWVRTCVAKMNAFLQENITGMSVVQIFVQEKRKFQQFDERNREHLDANLQSIFYYAVFYPAVNLIGALAIALILWYGGVQVLAGVLTLGSLVAFIQYSERFYKPISDLSEKFNILQTAMASSERIFRLLDTQPAISPPLHPVRLKSLKGKIEFRNVSFAYKEDTPVLRNISFSVAPGEKVAIVGATGSGKSTLINLLCRFYDVQSGEVRIDDTPVTHLDLDQLRQSISIVLQDVFLFSGTIEENIRLWERPIERKQVEDASRWVHADHFVQRLASGYDERVAERGSSLSVGQRQLLAFARALAHDPKILVLDEATSSVDTETELLIQDALEKLMKGRTAVVIAHRLSTIQNCDRILVLHRGQLIEQGSHQDLLKLRGVYYKLFQLQYRDQLASPRLFAPDLRASVGNPG